MWSCSVCRVSFNYESVESHLYTNHVRPRVGKVKVYNCGRCVFTGECFEDIARHCVQEKHDPNKVYKGLDHDEYTPHLLTALDEYMMKVPLKDPFHDNTNDNSKNGGVDGGNSSSSSTKTKLKAKGAAGDNNKDSQQDGDEGANSEEGGIDIIDDVDEMDAKYELNTAPYEPFEKASQGIPVEDEEPGEIKWEETDVLVGVTEDDVNLVGIGDLTKEEDTTFTTEEEQQESGKKSDEEKPMVKKPTLSEIIAGLKKSNRDKTNKKNRSESDQENGAAPPSKRSKPSGTQDSQNTTVAAENSKTEENDEKTPSGEEAPADSGEKSEKEGAAAAKEGVVGGESEVTTATNESTLNSTTNPDTTLATTGTDEKTRAIVMEGNRKLFKCFHCPKLLTTRQHAREHERNHSGERPYTCRGCERTFKINGNRRKHERKQHPDHPINHQKTNEITVKDLATLDQILNAMTAKKLEEQKTAASADQIEGQQSTETSRLSTANDVEQTDTPAASAASAAADNSKENQKKSH